MDKLTSGDAQARLDGVTIAVQTGAYVDQARSRISVEVLARQWLAGKVNLKSTTYALYDAISGKHVLALG